MKELTNQGIGTQVKRADPVLPNDEQALWDSDVFNIDLSTGLSYIVFFNNCKNFDFQEWKEILLGNIDVINKSYYFLTVLNLIQHLIFYSADNALGHFTTIVNTI
jgi:hypothetical protein